MDYEQKYLKYKAKYLALKAELEGAAWSMPSLGKKVADTPPKNTNNINKDNIKKEIEKIDKDIKNKENEKKDVYKNIKIYEDGLTEATLQKKDKKSLEHFEGMINDYKKRSLKLLDSINKLKVKKDDLTKKLA